MQFYHPQQEKSPPTTKRVQEKDIEVPEILKERIGNLTAASDVMFANGIPFLVSVLIRVNFTMV